MTVWLWIFVIGIAINPILKLIEGDFTLLEFTLLCALIVAVWFAGMEAGLL